ncbi:MAG: hypothetical protein PHF84_00185 [bacterium]|nr:hypothetical protein [bacterium]
MKKIIFLCGLFFFFHCKTTSYPYIVKGYYVNNNQQYEVEAYGLTKQDVQNAVQSRNIAKEAALIVAQKKVMDEFNIPQGKVIRSGLIKDVEFINNKTCRIIYTVDVNDLKEQ